MKVYRWQDIRAKNMTPERVAELDRRVAETLQRIRQNADAAPDQDQAEETDELGRAGGGNAN